MVARYGSAEYALIFVLVVVVVVVLVAVVLVLPVVVVLRGLDPMSPVIHSTRFLTIPGPTSEEREEGRDKRKNMIIT